jgi:branched-chain amino acid transport system substrate-binding protein
MSRLLLCAVMALFTLAGATRVAAQDLAIGLQAPLTGPQSQYGEAFRHGATLALEQFNAGGGVQGKPVQLLFQDSKSDPKEGVAIAQKFSDDTRVRAVLGDFGSTVSMASAEVYARTGLAQLTPSSSHPDFTKISRWQFRNIFTQEHEGRFTGQWLHEAGMRSVAVIALQNDFGLAVAENFSRSFERLGGKVTHREFFNPGMRDFRAILTKVARGRPDAIFLGVFYEEGALLMQQARQLGLTTRFFSGAGIYSPRLIELGGEAVEGLRLTSGFFPQLPDAAVTRFVAEYRRRFDAEPSFYAAQAFDATHMVLAALRRAGPVASREQVRAELEATIDFEGATGRASVDRTTREMPKRFIKLVVQGGRFALAP